MFKHNLKMYEHYLLGMMFYFFTPKQILNESLN